MGAIKIVWAIIIAEGVNIETFLKGAGPFKDTVYADELKKAGAPSWDSVEYRKTYENSINNWNNWNGRISFSRLLTRKYRL